MTIVGPAIAGIVIVTPGLGTAGAFDITAVCYAAAALFVMRLPKTLDSDKLKDARKFSAQMLDGFNYVFTERTLLLLLSSWPSCRCCLGGPTRCSCRSFRRTCSPSTRAGSAF